MAGKNYPSPGKLGVIEAATDPDIILFDGNPLEEVSVWTVGEIARLPGLCRSFC